MTPLKQLWRELNASLWFLPALMVAGAIALAVGLIETDRQISEGGLARWPRLFGAGVEGSRGMLSAIASSMIMIAGVAFSIATVARALASSPYTPRILRNFLRDRMNQFVLGFLSTSSPIASRWRSSPNSRTTASPPPASAPRWTADSRAHGPISASSGQPIIEPRPWQSTASDSSE